MKYAQWQIKHVQQSKQHSLWQIKFEQQNGTHGLYTMKPSDERKTHILCETIFTPQESPNDFKTVKHHSDHIGFVTVYEYRNFFLLRLQITLKTIHRGFTCSHHCVSKILDTCNN
jgi:hypothetical protein